MLEMARANYHPSKKGCPFGTPTARYESAFPAASEMHAGRLLPGYRENPGTSWAHLDHQTVDLFRSSITSNIAMMFSGGVPGWRLCT
jgi:hypothetical protein